MCGFVVVYGNQKIPNLNKVISESIDFIKHRGPDSKNFYSDNNITFAFQRLSIMDLSSKGSQPMISSNNRYVIVFNGEIYNFNELKKKIFFLGFKINSKSDTEILLNCYQVFKEKIINELIGIFSFIIYDKKKNSLFVARDPFGVKPLYYVKLNNGYIFASEIKSFLPFAQRNIINWDLNENCLYEQLVFRCLSGESTLIKNIKKVLPGYYFLINENNFSKKKYYNTSRVKRLNFNSFTNYEYEVENLLKNSVKNQMISDAEIGIALSGGIDSSLITAFASKFSKKKLNTFSIIFEKKSFGGEIFDESEYIKYITKKFNTNHNYDILTEKKYFDLFTKCIWHNDEPLNFPHSVGIYLLSNLAHNNNCKVLLGGEGADEFFAGYDSFKEKAIGKYKYSFSNPGLIKQLVLNYRNKNLTRDKYFKNSFKKINKQIYFSVNTYLQSIENRLDKMSMANSIEFRVPFIDKKIYELSLNLPDNLKINNKETKFILKKIAEKHFIKEHVYRKKIGFSIPINEWLRNKKLMGSYVSILSEKKTIDRNLYDKKFLEKLIYKFNNFPDQSKIYSSSGIIWSLINMELWCRMFLDNKNFKY